MYDRFHYRRSTSRSHGNYRANAGYQRRSVVVRKIPEELNNISSIHGHFAQFGTIIRVQTRHGGNPETALVTYSTNEEAYAAVSSPSPILNNRFIRVYWDNEGNDALSSVVFRHSRRPAHQRYLNSNSAAAPSDDLYIFEGRKCFEAEVDDVDLTITDSRFLTQLYCLKNKKLSKQITCLWQLLGSIKNAQDDQTRDQLKQLFDKYDEQHQILKQKIVNIMEKLKVLYESDNKESVLKLKRPADEKLDIEFFERANKESKYEMDTN